MHLVEKLEALVEAYNLGTVDAETFFAALRAFVAQLDEERQRAAREGLTEIKLAVFDLLSSSGRSLSANLISERTASRNIGLVCHSVTRWDDVWQYVFRRTGGAEGGSLSLQ